MKRPALVAIAATLALISGCDKAETRSTAEDRAAHNAAAAAMDASFDKEMGGPAGQPAAQPAKPAAKPTASTAAKPAAGKPAPAAGPAVEQGRPAWVDQLPVEEGKLYAVGGAPRGKRETAQANARKELAQSLRVNVKVNTTVSEGEITRIGPGGERVGKAWSDYRSEAQLSVDRDLNATTIAAMADDGKETWALAVLDRVAWAAQLRQEIAGVDAKLSAEQAAVGAAGGGLRPAAKALRTVGPLAARREALVNDLLLAEPTGQVPACPVDIQALLAACAKQLGTITVRLEGAPDAVFAARTQDAMARVGLTVTEKAGSAIGIRLALREASRKLPNGWTKINVAGSATVIDPATSNVAGSLQVDESAADPDEGQAKAKMLDNAAKALATAIDAQLIDLLAQ